TGHKADHRAVQPQLYEGDSGDDYSNGHHQVHGFCRLDAERTMTQCQRQVHSDRDRKDIVRQGNKTLGGTGRVEYQMNHNLAATAGGAERTPAMHSPCLADTAASAVMRLERSWHHPASV